MESKLFSAVKVAIRVRPLNERELNEDKSLIICTEKEKVSIIDPRVEENIHDGDSRIRIREFFFDYCFWSVDSSSLNYASQSTIFDELGDEVLQSVFDGYNACVFTYGQSGSGKTFTMLGSNNDEKDAGLVPRICKAIFRKIDSAQDEDTIYQTSVSYMEIYNEHVYDLLSSCVSRKPKLSLKIREHPQLGPYVQDLSKHSVTRSEDVIDLIDIGNNNRSVAATKYHQCSSRGHAIFTLCLTMIRKNCQNPSRKTSKIHLVDLAGSERANYEYSKTRLKEGANINKSLVTLGSVISSLAERSMSSRGSDSFNSISKEVLTFTSLRKKRQPFVPYRDSTLTWILKDTLGGNSKTFMIATVSPSSLCYHESLSTLRYAQRAKCIVNKPVINEDPNLRIIRELRAEVARLKTILVDSEILTHHHQLQVSTSKLNFRQLVNKCVGTSMLKLSSSSVASSNNTCHHPFKDNATSVQLILNPILNEIKRSNSRLTENKRVFADGSLKRFQKYASRDINSNGISRSKSSCGIRCGRNLGCVYCIRRRDAVVSMSNLRGAVSYDETRWIRYLKYNQPTDLRQKANYSITDDTCFRSHSCFSQHHMMDGDQQSSVKCKSLETFSDVTNDDFFSSVDGDSTSEKAAKMFGLPDECIDDYESSVRSFSEDSLNDDDDRRSFNSLDSLDEDRVSSVESDDGEFCYESLSSAGEITDDDCDSVDGKEIRTVDEFNFMRIPKPKVNDNYSRHLSTIDEDRIDEEEEEEEEEARNGDSNPMKCLPEANSEDESLQIIASDSSVMTSNAAVVRYNPVPFTVVMNVALMINNFINAACSKRPLYESHSGDNEDSTADNCDERFNIADQNESETCERTVDGGAFKMDSDRYRKFVSTLEIDLKPSLFRGDSVNVDLRNEETRDAFCEGNFVDDRRIPVNSFCSFDERPNVDRPSDRKERHFLQNSRANDQSNRLNVSSSAQFGVLKHDDEKRKSDSIVSSEREPDVLTCWAADNIRSETVDDTKCVSRVPPFFLKRPGTVEMIVGNCNVDFCFGNREITDKDFANENDDRMNTSIKDFASRKSDSLSDQSSPCEMSPKNERTLKSNFSFEDSGCDVSVPDMEEKIAGSPSSCNSFPMSENHLRDVCKFIQSNEKCGENRRKDDGTIDRDRLRYVNGTRATESSLARNSDYSKDSLMSEPKRNLSSSLWSHDEISLLQDEDCRFDGASSSATNETFNSNEKMAVFGNNVIGDSLEEFYRNESVCSSVDSITYVFLGPDTMQAHTSERQDGNGKMAKSSNRFTSSAPQLNFIENSEDCDLKANDAISTDKFERPSLCNTPGEDDEDCKLETDAVDIKKEWKIFMMDAKQVLENLTELCAVQNINGNRQTDHPKRFESYKVNRKQFQMEENLASFGFRTSDTESCSDEIIVDGSYDGVNSVVTSIVDGKSLYESDAGRKCSDEPSVKISDNCKSVESVTSLEKFETRRKYADASTSITDLLGRESFCSDESRSDEPNASANDKISLTSFTDLFNCKSSSAKNLSDVFKTEKEREHAPTSIIGFADRRSFSAANSVGSDVRAKQTSITDLFNRSSSNAKNSFDVLETNKECDSVTGLANRKSFDVNNSVESDTSANRSVSMTSFKDLFNCDSSCAKDLSDGFKTNKEFQNVSTSVTGLANPKSFGAKNSRVKSEFGSTTSFADSLNCKTSSAKNISGGFETKKKFESVSTSVTGLADPKSFGAKNCCVELGMRAKQRDATTSFTDLFDFKSSNAKISSDKLKIDDKYANASTDVNPKSWVGKKSGLEEFKTDTKRSVSTSSTDLLNRKSLIVKNSRRELEANKRCKSISTSVTDLVDRISSETNESSEKHRLDKKYADASTGATDLVNGKSYGGRKSHPVASKMDAKRKDASTSITDLIHCKFLKTNSKHKDPLMAVETKSSTRNISSKESKYKDAPTSVTVDSFDSRKSSGRHKEIPEATDLANTNVRYSTCDWRSCLRNKTSNDYRQKSGNRDVGCSVSRNGKGEIFMTKATSTSDLGKSAVPARSWENLSLQVRRNEDVGRESFVGRNGKLSMSWERSRKDTREKLSDRNYGCGDDGINCGSWERLSGESVPSKLSHRRNRCSGGADKTVVASLGGFKNDLRKADDQNGCRVHIKRSEAKNEKSKYVGRKEPSLGGSIVDSRMPRRSQESRSRVCPKHGYVGTKSRHCEERGKAKHFGSWLNGLEPETDEEFKLINAVQELTEETDDLQRRVDKSSTFDNVRGARSKESKSASFGKFTNIDADGGSDAAVTRKSFRQSAPKITVNNSPNFNETSCKDRRYLDDRHLIPLDSCGHPSRYEIVQSKSKDDPWKKKSGRVNRLLDEFRRKQKNAKDEIMKAWQLVEDNPVLEKDRVSREVVSEHKRTLMEYGSKMTSLDWFDKVSTSGDRYNERFGKKMKDGFSSSEDHLEEIMHDSGITSDHGDNTWQSSDRECGVGYLKSDFTVTGRRRKNLFDTIPISDSYKHLPSFISQKTSEYLINR